MLRIEIVKQSDGTGVLRCTRSDGSTTWQKQARHAAHFALHDMTHYAVETALGYRQGFFGLIDSGWDVDDTTGTGARGVLPSEATDVERIVGLFDAERAGGALWTAEELSAFAPRPLTADDVERIRAARGALFHRWGDVPPGEALVLSFP